jgi:hypothetical protein
MKIANISTIREGKNSYSKNVLVDDTVKRYLPTPPDYQQRGGLGSHVRGHSGRSAFFAHHTLNVKAFLTSP